MTVFVRDGGKLSASLGPLRRKWLAETSRLMHNVIVSLHFPSQSDSSLNFCQSGTLASGKALFQNKCSLQGDQVTTSIENCDVMPVERQQAFAVRAAGPQT